MKKILIFAAVVALMTACNNQPQTTEAKENKEEMKQELNLTQEWDKVFPLSDKVNHRKVTFETQYGLTLAADLYTPKAEVVADFKSPPTARHRSERTFWCCQGAVERHVRYEDGRARLCGLGFRPVLYW